MDNVVVVITGASKGIGREIANCLAKKGAIVVATGRNAHDLLELEKLLKQYNEKSFCRFLNVLDEDGICKLIDYIIHTLGKIDVWVNNAGISYTCLLQDTTSEIWDETMSVNLQAVFLCSKFVSKEMKTRGVGRIINIASMNSFKGDKYYTAYSASKHGVLGLTKALAIELADYGIRVNAVCPGVVMTDMMREAMVEEAKLEGLDFETIKERYLSNIPLRRFATGDDIGKVVSFLCSEEAEYLTGISISVAGGET